ncbi:MAG: acyl carrier protein [Lachnospiraceae bacterium]|nr:acyl carrier protein [Lachnospiraceae bacterium]
MTKNEILEKVQDVLRECFDDDELDVTMETTAADVDGWDSLRHITILAALEDEFRIRFSMNDARKAKNVGDLVDVIERLVKW